ncbi:hypothetical protein F5878DRAFT_637668, partial [Lentinula raphanica]
FGQTGAIYLIVAIGSLLIIVYSSGFVDDMDSGLVGVNCTPSQPFIREQCMPTSSTWPNPKDYRVIYTASVELLVAFKLPATCHCCRVQIYPYYSAVGQSVGVEHSIWARNMVHEGSSKLQKSAQTSQKSENKSKSPDSDG